MTDTAATATQLVANTDTPLVALAGTAIDATGTLVITPLDNLEDMIIIVVNTTASQKVATVKAGANPPAALADADLAITLATGSVLNTLSVVQLSSSKYIQKDGTIHMTFASGMTGWVKVYQLSGKA